LQTKRADTDEMVAFSPKAAGNEEMNWVWGMVRDKLRIILSSSSVSLWAMAIMKKNTSQHCGGQSVK